MERYEHDEAGNNKDFYRDSFGERITREDDGVTRGQDQTMPDKPIMDEDDATVDANADFRESLYQTDTASHDDATTLDPADDGKTEQEPSLGDKIREKFNDLSGDDRK